MLYGALALLASMPGSLIPRALGLGGEDWLATATMRYVWSVVFLSLYVRSKFGSSVGRELVNLFRLYPTFWLIWALISGPATYVPYVYAATQMPAWLIAVTSRMDVLTTVLVLRLFGQRVERRKMYFLSLMFMGVVLVNISNAQGKIDMKGFLAVWLLLLATLLEPLSNQLMRDARWGRELRPRWIPHIDTKVGTSSHCWVLLLYVLCLPQMGIGLAVHPVLPSFQQIWSTAIMAVCSSLVSVPLWMEFQHSAGRSANSIALAGAMPALGIVFSLLAEIWLFHGAWPGSWGWTGIVFVIGGFFLYVRH